MRVQAVEEFARFKDLVLEYEASLPEDLRHRQFTREVGDIARHYGPPNAAFVATVNEAAAGCVALTMLDGTTAVVKKMYVPPEYRNQGIARALMAALTDYARGRGVTRLVLDTARERLQAAYALYRSLGFRECQPYGEVDYRCPTFMEMFLEPP